MRIDIVEDNVAVEETKEKRDMEIERCRNERIGQS
jgi:hypothetical protein